MDINTINKIEKVLNVKLAPWQKEYLLYGTSIPDICPCLIEVDFLDKDDIRNYLSYKPNDKNCYYRGRRIGKTFAHCIKLALSEGKPLDVRYPEKFSDNSYENIRYARNYYRPMFYDIWCKLKDAGFPVRPLIGLK